MAQSLQLPVTPPSTPAPTLPAVPPMQNRWLGTGSGCADLIPGIGGPSGCNLWASRRQRSARAERSRGWLGVVDRRPRVVPTVPQARSTDQPARLPRCRACQSASSTTVTLTSCRRWASRLARRFRALSRRSSASCRHSSPRRRRSGIRSPDGATRSRPANRQPRHGPYRGTWFCSTCAAWARAQWLGHGAPAGQHGGRWSCSLTGRSFDCWSRASATRMPVIQ